MIEIDMAIIERLAKPFFDQGDMVVYYAMCCGRVAVTPVRPQCCGTCPKEIRVFEYRKPA